MSASKIFLKNDLKKDLPLKELEILLEVSKIAGSTQDLDETLYNVHALLPKLVPHQKSCIFFYQEKSGTAILYSNIGFSERFNKIFAEDKEQSLLFKWQIENKKSWRATDMFPAEEIRKSSIYQSALRHEGVFYSAGAPILLDGSLIGTVFAARPEGRHDFTQKELLLLDLVAQNIGTAVRNALAFEKGRQEKEHIISVMERKVKRAERLAALGRAAAIIAHEVKNPLTSIRLSLYSLEKKKAWAMDFTEDLNIVKAAVERVSRTMEDLLHFSGESKLLLKEIDLNDLLRKLVGDLKNQTPSAAVIETSLNKQIPYVMVDSEKIKQVFENLISNAISANESGGTVRVSTDTHIDRVVVTVEDWGCGIAPEVQQKIFEPFFTTKLTGTGLGLAIAKKNIEAHRGLIEVESEPGWGTKFTVVLPVYSVSK